MNKEGPQETAERKITDDNSREPFLNILSKQNELYPSDNQLIETAEKKQSRVFTYELPPQNHPMSFSTDPADRLNFKPTGTLTPL